MKQDFKISELIPQKPPAVMIDDLLNCSSKTATGQLTIRESNIFVHKGCLQEAGIVEFMAQTAAAYTGYRNKMAKEPFAEGYIGAIKNLVIYKLPAANTTIQSEITIDNEIMGYTIISGKVMFHDAMIAGCEMRILTEV